MGRTARQVNGQDGKAGQWAGWTRKDKERSAGRMNVQPNGLDIKKLDSQLIQIKSRAGFPLDDKWHSTV